MTIEQTHSPDSAIARQDLIDRLRTELPAILRERPVMIAYLYGSVAEGYALPNSNIAVALVLAPDHGLPVIPQHRREPVVDIHIPAVGEPADGDRIGARSKKLSSHTNVVSGGD